MIKQIKVIPNAKKNLIKQEPERLKIYVTSPPIDNKANSQIIKLLADYYNLKKTDISIIRGAKSSLKTVKINGK